MARLRLVLARRPWLRWALVVTAAMAVGLTVAHRLTGLEQQRSAWGEVRTVVVARRTLPPGTPVGSADVVLDERPVAVVPAQALTGLDQLTDLAHTWQWVEQGEVLVAHDVDAGASAAARLPTGTRGVVVAAHGLPTRSGDAVELVVDGQAVSRAVVIDVLAGGRDTFVSAPTASLLIAVPQRNAAAVAAAVAEGRATVVLAPGRDDQRQPATNTTPITAANATR